MMKNFLGAMVLVGIWTVQLHAAWELDPPTLEKMILKSDLIAEAHLPDKQSDQKELSVEESIQGSQRIQTIKLADRVSLEQFKEEIKYIVFCQHTPDGFTLIEEFHGALKSDLFLKTRIQKEVMRLRVKKADLVVLAQMKEVIESQTPNQEQQLLVQAKCQKVEEYKGSVEENFEAIYTRTPRSYPPQVILFKNLSYIMFLKKTEKSQVYRLLDAYEGAYPDRYYLRKEVRKATQDAASKIKNRFEQMAGKVSDGLRLVAQAVKAKVSPNEAVRFHFLLQNASDKKIEIYHNQVLYFTLFHVISENNEVVPVNYPKKNSVPPIDKRYFLELSPGGYFVLPSIDLSNYCQLESGKRYSVYIEFNLPWEYSGKTIGKSAWSGKVVSNEVTIEIE